MSALSCIDMLFAANIYNDRMPKCFKAERSTHDYLTASSIIGSLIILIVLYSIICYRLWRRNIISEVSNNQQALDIRTARKVTVLVKCNRVFCLLSYFRTWQLMQPISHLRFRLPSVAGRY